MKKYEFFKVHKQLFGGPGSGPNPGDGKEQDGDNDLSNTIPRSEDPVLNLTSDKTGKPLAEEVVSKLNELGIKGVGKIEESNTQFGNSYYIYIKGTEEKNYEDKIKIRISDHQVSNQGRINNEEHLSGKNMGGVLFTIEKEQYPDRFKVIKSERIETSKINDLQQGLLRPTDKIISERTTPKGNKIYNVERNYKVKTEKTLRKKQKEQKMNKPKLTAREALVQIGKLLKMDFAKVEKFESAKLADGTEIMWDGELAEGTALMVVAADGNQMPAPDAAHELEDGTIVTTVGGLVTAIEPKKEVESPEEMASKFHSALLELTEKFAAMELDFNAMNEKFTAYESKFTTIEETIVKTDEKFVAITKIVEDIAAEPIVVAAKPTNSTFSKKESSLTAIERIAEFKKLSNK